MNICVTCLLKIELDYQQMVNLYRKTTASYCSVLSCWCSLCSKGAGDESVCRQNWCVLTLSAAAPPPPPRRDRWSVRDKWSVAGSGCAWLSCWQCRCCGLSDLQWAGSRPSSVPRVPAGLEPGGAGLFFDAHSNDIRLTWHRIFISDHWLLPQY